MTGVTADEGLVEHASGELIESFFFDGLEQARADLGGFCHLIQCDLPLFAFALEALAEGSHLAFSLASVNGLIMYTELRTMLSKQKPLGEARR